MLLDIPAALIVEDDPQVRALLHRILVSEGFDVLAVATCLDAKQSIRNRKPDLVLLDLGLPGGDGLDLGKWIRSALPLAGILILSGRTEVKDRVAGLNACADDYVTKPFDIDELQARIRNLMRRIGGSAASILDAIADIPFERWLLREDNCALISETQEVKLTLMEFRLLKALILRQGRVATREWLLDQLGAEVDINERTVDYHVCTLRIKLRKAGLREDVITSVRGMGYKYTSVSQG